MSKRILITCGPTWVPIDNVRVLSNISSGKLGQGLAQELTRKGAKVTLLEGPVETPLVDLKIRVVKFRTFDELFGILKAELKKSWDIIIHAAAVSDYHPKIIKKGKFSSSAKSLKLELVRTPKIINTIKKFNRNVFLIGFKLDPLISRTNAVVKTKYLFRDARCDLAVANKISGNKYHAYLIDAAGKIKAEADSRSELATTLIKHLGTLK